MNIIYADSDIIVVDKPGGLLAVPGRGPEKQDCVVNRLKMLFPGMIQQPAVHRLDMYTSGVMLLAVNTAAHRDLSRQFEARKISKKYTALVEGIIEAPAGRIELKFRLDPNNRPYQVFDPLLGKAGITLWKRLGRENNRTRIEFTPLSGRTHQLRVHSAHALGLNAPIVGDHLYGNGSEGEQMMLHAFSLCFSHPATHETVFFQAATPF